MKKLVITIAIMSIFVFVVYGADTYVEDFEKITQDDLSEKWIEKNAFGDNITEDRIVKDPKDAENKVYWLNWDPLEPGVQLLKWGTSLQTYNLSVDVKGGKVRPEFTGERSSPAMIYLRTTTESYGIPEYENAGGEISFGTAGVQLSLQDSWVSIDIKTADNSHYKDMNKGDDGNWIYFIDKGNNCNANFTNLTVTDDGSTMTINWNGELLCTVEMSEIETIENVDVVADFYTKAVIKNAKGEIISTITDARIASGEDATIAFTVRATDMYLDNLSLTYVEAEPNEVEKTPSLTNTPNATGENVENTTKPDKTFDISPSEKTKSVPKVETNKKQLIIASVIAGVILIAVIVLVIAKTVGKKRR